MSAFMFSDKEISNTTSYIKDDSYVASVYGVTRYRVARLRKEREEAKAAAKAAKAADNSRSNGWTDSETAHRKKMQEGSAQLLEALLNYLHERDVRSRMKRKD